MAKFKNMRHFLLGFLLLTAISCKTTNNLKVLPPVIEEEGFELELVFQPDSEYLTNLVQVTSTSMSIPNMPEQSTESKVSTTSTLSFGPLLNKQSEMLIVYNEMDMEVIGVGTDQAEAPSLVGIKIHGKLSEGIQSIDSIVGGDETLQNMLKSLMEPMFVNMQVDFPNPMKIGDEFLDNKVVEIPIEGMGSTTINTDTKYTLIKVHNDVAELATQINLTGNMSMMGKEIPISGKGSGAMSIDLKQLYSPSSTTLIDQEITMDLGGETMVQKVTVSLTTDTQKLK